MKKPATISIHFLLSVVMVFGGCSSTSPDLVNLDGLRATGNDWEIVNQDSSDTGGSLTLHQGKWAMFFLHWRPIPEDELSVDYVRHTLLNFWGPDMPFETSGGGGLMDWDSRQVYYHDGTIYDGAIKTRFIIWNCPETNRQIIADCNINVASGSPDSILEMQYEMASTIACDGGQIDHNYPALTSGYSSSEYAISFAIPDNWRTHEYTSSEWFPNGQSISSGTLWTLMTDAERHVELVWTESTDEISEEMLRNRLSMAARITPDPSGGSVEISEISVGSVESRHGYLVADGGFEYTLRVDDQEGTEPYRFKAFLWENGGRTYSLIASVVLRTELWQRSVDLSPSAETFESFLTNELLPNIPVFDEEYP